MACINLLIGVAVLIVSGATGQVAISVSVEGGNIVANASTTTIRCSFSNVKDDHVMRLGWSRGDEFTGSSVIAYYFKTLSSNPNYVSPFDYPAYEMTVDNIGSGESGYSELMIASTTLQDEGRYWCSVILINGPDPIVDSVDVIVVGLEDQNDIIGPSPVNQAVLVGDTHTLNCRKLPGVDSNIAWFNSFPDRYPILISIGVLKPIKLEKYDNFAIVTDNLTRYDLQISNISVEDEGAYYCMLLELSVSSETITRTVEVPCSSLQMTQQGDNVTTATVTEGESSIVICTALGSRPVVEIVWYHQVYGGIEIPITTGVTQTNTSSDNSTFDTVSTLQYTASKDYHGGRLRCETTGQQVAQSREASASLNVQYAPDVSVSFHDPMVYCSADANPKVEMDSYVIIVNGTEEYTPTCTDDSCTLTLTINEDTPVKCNATNAIGTGIAMTIAAQGATTPMPSIVETAKPSLAGFHLTLNLSTVCTSNPPSDDGYIVVKVDGSPVAIDLDITLPSSGCLTIECSVTQGSWSDSKKREVCTDVKPTSGISIVAVAVPLAAISAVFIILAIIVIWGSRQSSKEGHVGQKAESNVPNQRGTTGPNEVQTYMELDATAREKETTYQEPQARPHDAQFPMYEDVAEDVNNKDRVYQEIGGNYNQETHPKEYVNVPPIN